jgi:hypothetical protein
MEGAGGGGDALVSHRPTRRRACGRSRSGRAD